MDNKTFRGPISEKISPETYATANRYAVDVADGDTKAWFDVRDAIAKALHEQDSICANVSDFDRLNEVLDALWKEAESAYLKAFELFSKTECLGWEAKIRTGVFGKAEYEAHKKANELIGRHHGMAYAIKTIRAALAKEKHP